MGIVVVNHISLDGVMQGPGRPDEDTRSGFEHGGWGATADDPAIGRAMAGVMGTGFAWLFGHRSYDDMLGYWNREGGYFADGLNATIKHVAVSADVQLPWPNSVALTGDVVRSVRTLRAEFDGNLVIMGSGELIRSLLPYNLIDEMLLMIHPLTLGSGRQLFPDDRVLRRFHLENVDRTEDGVILARYRAAI